jgi:hypothetical protein
MIHKKAFLFIAILFLMKIPLLGIAKEITIYDSSGQATAYVDTDDERPDFKHA